MALETSGTTAGVAVLDGERLLALGETPPQVRAAAGLAPLVQDVFSRAGVPLRDAKLISLPVGPGSFTGLRVGVTTAKTLAYALGCGVLGLDTLEVIAAQSPPEVGELWAVVDAQREQLIVRRFAKSDGQWIARGEPEIVSNDAFLGRLAAGEFVSGPGLKRIAAQLPPDVATIAPSLWSPRAETAGRLAIAKYQAGARGDLWQLVPHYFRPSAAEEKRAAKP